jgi:hypothetical protein
MSIKSTLQQTSFTGGEISPSLYGRVDLQRYQNGLRTCRNFFVRAHGGVSNRAGLRFVCPVKDYADEVRLIPFSFSTEQTYVLEFGDQYMRVIKDGGQVLESAQNITGATQANPCVVTITGHSYSNGDWVYIAGVEGMTQLNGRWFEIANTTANTFELSGVDSTGYDAYTTGGTGSRVYEIATPYSAAEAQNLKFVQSADVLYLTHPSHEQKRLSRTGDTSWSLDGLSFEVSIGKTTITLARWLDSIGNPGTYPDGVITEKYVVTAVDSTNGEEGGVSNEITASRNLVWTAGSKIRLTWGTVTGATDYNIYKKTATDVYEYIGDTTGLTFDDNNITPTTGRTPPESRNPFADSNYPSTTTFFEDRLVFANSTAEPQTLWMSQTSNYENYDVSIPPRDDQSVTLTVNARQVNAIRHMIPLNDLLLLTSGAVWQVSGGNSGDPITPSQARVKLQSEDGSADIPPIVIGSTVLFVQDKGQNVRDLGYRFEDDAYNGSDLSVMSRHLFEGYTIRDWTYARVPNSLVWAVRSDGALLGLTYMREHDVWGWHQHDTDGTFENAASVGEGSEDVTYFVVKRTVNGESVRYIERMESRFFTDQREAFFVDSGLTLNNPLTISGATQADPVVLTITGHGLANGDFIDVEGLAGMTELNDTRFKVANVTANTVELTNQYTGNDVDGTGYTAYTSGGEARKAVNSIGGLWHLEGKTLSVLSNGNVEPATTVTNGTASLQNYGSRITAGLGYTADIETLDLNAPIEGGALQARRRKVGSLAAFVEETRGMWVAESLEKVSGDEAYELKQRENEFYTAPVALKTGVVEILPAGSWGLQGRVAIQQRDPLPITVLSLMPEMNVER